MRNYDKSNAAQTVFYDEAVRAIEEERNYKKKQGYLIPILDPRNVSLSEKYSIESEPLLSIVGWNSHNNDFYTLTKKEIDNLKEMREFF